MPEAPAYALFLVVVQHPVLIVGGGAVALRKARGLVASAARVTVVSPDFHEGFANLPDIERIASPYMATHMARKMWRLVFAATNVKEVNEMVFKHASAAGIFCCRCDEPEEGDFFGGATERLGANRKSDGRGVKAVADSGGVTLMVGTGGASPMLAARICRQAALAVDPVLPALANLTVKWRALAKARIADADARRALLQRVAGEEMEKVLRAHGAEAAQRVFALWFDEVCAGGRKARGAAMVRRQEAVGDKGRQVVRFLSNG